MVVVVAVITFTLPETQPGCSCSNHEGMEPPTDRQAGLLPSQGSERDCAVGALKARTQPGAQPVAVAVLAGRKAELGERRGEAEALRSCRKSFLGATVRCSRRCHLRSKARSRSSGY